MPYPLAITRLAIWKGLGMTRFFISLECLHKVQHLATKLNKVSPMEQRPAEFVLSVVEVDLNQRFSTFCVGPIPEAHGYSDEAERGGQHPKALYVRLVGFLIAGNIEMTRLEVMILVTHVQAALREPSSDAVQCCRGLGSPVYMMYANYILQISQVLNDLFVALLLYS